MPRPLEKIVWDADLVVVAHLDAPPEPPATEAGGERAAFLRCADSAVVSSGSDHGYVRTEGLRYLVQFGDQRAPERIVAVLRSVEPKQRRDIAMIGRGLVRAHPGLGDVLLGRLVAAVDSDWAVSSLRRVTGDDALIDAAACRKWWKARAR